MPASTNAKRLPTTSRRYETTNAIETREQIRNETWIEMWSTRYDSSRRKLKNAAPMKKKFIECSLIFLTVVITKMTKKNRKSETGAAKVICLTHGPGLSFRGMTIPILTPESRLAYCHFKSHPEASCVFCVGERLLCGKSIWSKSVRISSEKSLI